MLNAVESARGQGDSAVFAAITRSLSDISLDAVQGCRCAFLVVCFIVFVCCYFFLDHSFGLLQAMGAHAG